MRTPLSDNAQSGASRWPSGRSLQLAFVLLALAYALPVGSCANDRLTHVNQAARERLIRAHRLWELQPDFRGKPEIWARMASRLLNDQQLLARVATKYRGQSQQHELEYRRDLSIARAEVVVTALGIWAVPLAILYATAWAFRRRKPAPPQKPTPPSTADPRYLPPG